ncbi:unannotated protein [freshwater metagenome]|uniref:Unannotated protein n=1 Tax=freshwater metagenome TaxID=449393 RepID=A0A6J6EHK4_9ZZZZ
MRPGLHCHVEPIAGVSAGAEWLHVVTEVRHHHVSVPFESATCENDALTCSNACAVAVVLYDDSDGGTSLIGDEVFGWRRQPNAHLAI